LIELLFVAVIVSVIAALAVPGLRRARLYANAGSAVQSLRTITSAEYMHERKTKVYATLNTLAAEMFINGELADGYKSSYLFAIQVGADSKTFTCTATPDSDTGVLDHFFVDQTGVIRYKTGAPADATSDPIPR
jgi:type II secretory pathway pseudopilin PulG